MHHYEDFSLWATIQNFRSVLSLLVAVSLVVDLPLLTKIQGLVHIDNEEHKEQHAQSS